MIVKSLLAADPFPTDTEQLLVLDATWALWDSPDKYAVSVSNDGANWGQPIATGASQMGNHEHYLSGSDRPLYQDHANRDDPTHHWSIYELDVYKKK